MTAFTPIALTYRVKYRQKGLSKGHLRNIRGCKDYFLFIVLLLQGGGV